MTSERVSLAEKIRNCFARATSPFDGEARTAAHMARNMMEKHGFTLQDLGKGQPPVWNDWVAAAVYFWENWDQTDFQSTDTDTGTLLPLNWATGRHYKGRNIDILQSAGFTSHYWLGFHQAKKLGGHVVKGQKGTKIYRWDIRKVEDELTGKERMRYRRITLTVFNAEQILGIDFDGLTSERKAVA
jgi:hypothetical protein